MRDLVLFAHLIIGLALITFSIIVLLYLDKKPRWLKPLSAAIAALSWAFVISFRKIVFNFLSGYKNPGQSRLLLRRIPW